MYSRTFRCSQFDPGAATGQETVRPWTATAMPQPMSGQENQRFSHPLYGHTTPAHLPRPSGCGLISGRMEYDISRGTEWVQSNEREAAGHMRVPHDRESGAVLIV